MAELTREQREAWRREMYGLQHDPEELMASGASWLSFYMDRVPPLLDALDAAETQLAQAEEQRDALRVVAKHALRLAPEAATASNAMERIEARLSTAKAKGEKLAEALTDVSLAMSHYPQGLRDRVREALAAWHGTRPCAGAPGTSAAGSTPQKGSW